MGYNPQQMIDRINNQIKELEGLRNNYQNVMQPAPVNNFINTNQQLPQNDMIEMRILNENEQVDNIYVQNKTLFLNEKNMILKDTNGKLEKWNIKKIYPIDEKDIKIDELSKKVAELEARLNEPKQSIESINKFNQSDADVIEYVEPESETTGKSIAKSKSTRTSTMDSRLGKQE